MQARVALIGASGRMGARIDALAASDASMIITRRYGRTGCANCDLAVPIDAIIDFSNETGTRQAMAIARESSAALLVGTTGLSAEIQQELAVLARTNAVLVAPNTSLGIAVTRKLARMAAVMLAPSGWTVDIVESHHDRKKDAPSGTAIALARALESGGMQVPADRIHAIRAGDTIGEHEIRLAGPSERIHLMHQAVSRDLFAAGAIRAAKWLGDLFWKGGDQKIIDGFGPDGVSALSVQVGKGAGRLQSGYVYHYAFVMLLGVAGLLTFALWAWAA